MPEISSKPLDTENDSSVIKRAGPKRWQLGLRTLVLLMAVIAVWLTVVANRRRNAELETRIKVMIPLAHELKIDDVGSIAVVRMDEIWTNDNRWDLYLPPGEYRVCVATREIDKKGLTAARKSAPIKTGKHRLELEFRNEADRWPIRVTSEGSELLAIEESKDWGSSGSSTDSKEYSQSTQLPSNQPLVLYRRRYLEKVSDKSSWATPNGPVNGLLLWIEPMPVSKPVP